MSVSPPKDGEGAGENSTVNSPQEDMNQQSGEAQPHAETYDFDVKEQDRWLPIANGRSINSPCHLCPKMALHLRTKVDKKMFNVFARLFKSLRHMQVVGN